MHYANKASASASAASSSETKSKTSETNAKASEVASAASQSASANHEAASLASKNKSQEWAEKAENSQVESGQYSAKHHAIKSADSAASALASKNASASSESKSKTSETNAKASENAAEAAAVRAETAAVTASNGVVDRGPWDASSGEFPVNVTDPFETTDWYRISAAGLMSNPSNPSQEDIDVAVGDNLYWDKAADVWYKIDNTEQVTSVNGMRGAVVLAKSHVGLSNVPNYSISNTYTSTGTNFASRKAVYDAYTALNGAKLGKSENAVSATKLLNARTISLGGDLSGSASFNGTANITITATVKDDSHAHTIANVDGLQAALDAKLDGNGGKATDSDKLDGYDSSAFIRSFQVEDGDGTEVTINHGKEWKFVEGGGIDINWTDTSPGSDADPFDLTFTVTQAPKLATARTITFNGDVSGSYTFDGSANKTVTLAVANDSHTHDGRYYTESESNARFANVSGDTFTGQLNIEAGLKLNWSGVTGIMPLSRRIQKGSYHF
ncbi:phage tail fiber protein [Vibrio maritimus]|uniref:Phage tail fiber protein n=1 Tax=Vibrio maritimus TaxID=990268 RepID=A0A090S812_9VIBR|nr:phage tail fiber protein [Vibrio maritimus]